MVIVLSAWKHSTSYGPIWTHTGRKTREDSKCARIRRFLDTESWRIESKGHHSCYGSMNGRSGRAFHLLFWEQCRSKILLESSALVQPRLSLNFISQPAFFHIRSLTLTLLQLGQRMYTALKLQRWTSVHRSAGARKSPTMYWSTQLTYV